MRYDRQQQKEDEWSGAVDEKAIAEWVDSFQQKIHLTKTEMQSVQRGHLRTTLGIP